MIQLSEIYKSIVRESKIYTLQQVEKIQSRESRSSDIIFNSNENDLFELKKIDINKITINNKRPWVSLSAYAKKDLDEDYYIVKSLINKYETGIKINPIVVTEKLDIMDGIHRYVAQRELGLKLITVFQRIKN